jgi:hypothetical protein
MIPNLAELWYAAPPSGVYSEKACYGGQPGIGHPAYATVATGGTLYVAATGLFGRPSVGRTTLLLLSVPAVQSVTNGGSR